MHITLFATADGALSLQALKKLPVEDVLLPVLIQLGLVILTARVFAGLFLKLGQPGVVGEIAAGLVLGPSLLGRLFPDVFRTVFHPGGTDLPDGVPPELFDALLGWTLTTLSQLGLIFLLFLVGLEFDFSHLRWHGSAALAISLAGVALPFFLGSALAIFMLPYLEHEVPLLGFTLFLGTALSITAIPVLGRIMTELNITRTRLAAVTITAAAVDDASGWILLASVAAVVKGAFAPSTTAWMIAETISFALIMICVAGPVLRRWARHAVRDGDIGLNSLAGLLVLVLACAIVTNRIGIFAVFGAFTLGAVLSAEHAFRDAVLRRLRDFVSAFFVPIFFAYTGLRTDIGSLDSWLLVGLCVLVSALAIVGKLGGCGVAARLGGFPRRDAACIGAMMNTRGLMELVVINLGKDLGVMPDSVFCMLVIMALVTTVMTTPLLLWLMPGTELEPYIRQSGFAEAQPAEEVLTSVRSSAFQAVFPTGCLQTEAAPWHFPVARLQFPDTI